MTEEIPTSYEELYSLKPRVKGYLRRMGIAEQYLDDAVSITYLRLIQSDIFALYREKGHEKSLAQFKRFLHLTCRSVASNWRKQSAKYFMSTFGLAPAPEIHSATTTVDVEFPVLLKDFCKFVDRQSGSQRLSQVAKMLYIGYKQSAIALHFNVPKNVVTKWKNNLMELWQQYEK